MKKVLFLSLVLLASLSMKAQNDFNLGIGAHAGLTTTGGSQFLLGADLQGEYKFSNMASVVGSLGYTQFLVNGGGFGAVPVLAGARLYPDEKFFIGAQIGYGLFTQTGGGSGFAFKPGFGYNSDKMQISLDYNGISNMGTFSWLSLTTTFKLGKK